MAALVVIFRCLLICVRVSLDEDFRDFDKGHNLANLHLVWFIKSIRLVCLVRPKWPPWLQGPSRVHGHPWWERSEERQGPITEWQYRQTKQTVFQLRTRDRSSTAARLTTLQLGCRWWLEVFKGHLFSVFTLGGLAWSLAWWGSHWLLRYPSSGACYNFCDRSVPALGNSQPKIVADMLLSSSFLIFPLPFQGRKDLYNAGFSHRRSTAEFLGGHWLLGVLASLVYFFVSLYFEVMWTLRSLLGFMEQPSSKLASQCLNAHVLALLS